MNSPYNYVNPNGGKETILIIMIICILAFFAFVKSVRGQDFCSGISQIEIPIQRATVYQAVPNQTNSDNFTTASGFRLNKDFNHLQYRIIAVSRDLLQHISYGDTVTVIGTTYFDGKWIVHDTMNKRYTRTIDFLTDLDQPNILYNNITLIK